MRKTRHTLLLQRSWNWYDIADVEKFAPSLHNFWSFHWNSRVIDNLVLFLCSAHRLWLLRESRLYAHMRKHNSTVQQQPQNHPCTATRCFLSFFFFKQKCCFYSMQQICTLFVREVNILRMSFCKIFRKVLRLWRAAAVPICMTREEKGNK